MTFADPSRLPGPSFTCPRCARTSHHPADVTQGYCGYCRDWTRSLAVGMFQLVGPELPGQAGTRAAARYIAERYGGPDMAAFTPLDGLSIEMRGFVADPNMVSRLITAWSRNRGLIPPDSAERQDEADNYPWCDAASWSPGYAEPE